MKQVIRKNPELFRLIARFHGQPSQLIHADHWPAAIPPEIRRLLQSTPAGERRLMNWMTETWQFEDYFQWSFEEPRHRITLLSPEQLMSLLLHFSAAVHSRTITSTIDGKTQSKYREALGNEIYVFDLKRAAFLVRELPAELANTRPPVDSIENSVLQAAVDCLQRCLHDAPTELWNRAGLMLPGSISLTKSNEPVARHADAVWKLTHRILLTEVARGTGRCFN
jgi:hypothetical protein